MAVFYPDSTREVYQQCSFGAMNPVQRTRVDTERAYGAVMVCVNTPRPFRKRECIHPN